MRTLAIALLLAVSCAGALAAASGQIMLPSGWRLAPPPNRMLDIGTMPQGLALSPDGSTLAVVESGVAPAGLRLVQIRSLHSRDIALPGAFGKPVWLDATHIAVAGANADAVLVVNAADGTLRRIPSGHGTWPAAVVRLADGTFATANDGGGSVSIGGHSVLVGEHPSDLALSRDGRVLYVAVRRPSRVLAIDVASERIFASVPTLLHPAALALSQDGSRLYVAQSDDDSVGVIDTRTNALLAQIPVALRTARLHNFGASPNALCVRGTDLFVSLGAENAVALVRNDRVVERIPTGWYPTGIVLGNDGTLYVVNGKGESAPPNPQFDPFDRRSPGYVGVMTRGSLRVIPAQAYEAAASSTERVLDNAEPQWTPAPASSTVLRAHGPIAHVIYVIKENRSYDQVLGDIAQADGDAKLAMFGQRVTPNQHALAARFGVFDNSYVNAQVSADGHNWTDAAFANDYVERFWPPNYGGRRDLYDFQAGGAPDVPHGGYLWDAAKRARVSYRDYGEDIDFSSRLKIGINTFPGLSGHFDPRYVGWDLHTSDDTRLAEWTREFNAFVAFRSLPQLEIVYLPNDHTAGTSPGMLTPQAYVATNDWAVGRLVQAVSRSPYWSSTAIFILEDDAQNGPDHVSDQRSTFYVASPYARAGVQHAHYSTASFVHTIELILGMQPLSTYDAAARPLYDAFSAQPANARPFTALKPEIDVHAVNARTAYGSAISARLDFRYPDRVDPRVLNDILAHAVHR